MAEVPLFNPNDGLTGRDGGPYLDEEEARLAEKRRAFIENREPDLDNPGPTAGIQLVTAAQLIHQVGTSRGPVSQERTAGAASGSNASKMVQAIVDDEDNNFHVFDKINQSEVDRMSKEAENRDLDSSDFNPDDPNAPVTNSSGDLVDGSVNLSGKSQDDVAKNNTDDVKSSKSNDDDDFELSFTPDPDLDLNEAGASGTPEKKTSTTTKKSASSTRK